MGVGQRVGRVNYTKATREINVVSTVSCVMIYAHPDRQHTKDAMLSDSPFNVAGVGLKRFRFGSDFATIYLPPPLLVSVVRITPKNQSHCIL